MWVCGRVGVWVTRSDGFRSQPVRNAARLSEPPPLPGRQLLNVSLPITSPAPDPPPASWPPLTPSHPCRPPPASHLHGCPERLGVRAGLAGAAEAQRPVAAGAAVHGREGAEQTHHVLLQARQSEVAAVGEVACWEELGFQGQGFARAGRTGHCSSAEQFQHRCAAALLPRISPSLSPPPTPPTHTPPPPPLSWD